MPDDLLDAQAAVDWAVAQIPLLQNGFLEWNKDPYQIVKEPDPDGGGYLLVAQQRVPFPLVLNVWTGAIIGSLRSALDFTAATLAKRNGKKPSADTHFPIFESELDMIDPLTGIEREKWLTKRERTAIKSFKPYRGGNHAIWAIHKLNNLRKHERLISARPDVHGFLWTPGAKSGKAGMRIVGMRGMERAENKTILYRSNPTDDFDPTEGDLKIAAFVSFNEMGVGLVDQEVATVLHHFAARVAEVVQLFRPFGDLRDLLPLHAQNLGHTVYRRQAVKGC
jgi:hypothetical protein